MCVVAQGLQSDVLSRWLESQTEGLCVYRGVNYPFEEVVSMRFLKVTNIRVQEQSR